MKILKTLYIKPNKCLDFDMATKIYYLQERSVLVVNTKEREALNLLHLLTTNHNGWCWRKAFPKNHYRFYFGVISITSDLSCRKMSLKVVGREVVPELNLAEYQK